MKDSKAQGRPTSESDVSEAMKLGMRRLASGVVVLATQNDQAEPQGMTVTAVNSLSDSPPSLLVCIHRDTGSLRALKHTQQFSINVLGEHQQDVSDKFAFSAEGKSRFEYGDWVQDARFSSLYLSDSLATFFCSSQKYVDYGTHCIVIADIEAVRVGTEVDAKPLVYFDSGYRSIE